MNPNNGQTPLDYLNQIAPEAPKKPFFEPKLNLRNIVLFGIIAIILVIIISLVSSSLTASRKQPWQHLSARLDATATSVDTSSTLIKNTTLRGYNSDLKLYITNTKRDLEPFLVSLQIDSAALPASVTAAETSTGLAQNLEDGRLNAKYDSTYVREMSYQLATILSLLQSINASSSGTKTLEFTETAYNNLYPIYTKISEFSADNE